MNTIITGMIIDIVRRRIFAGRINIASGRISSIEEVPDLDVEARRRWIAPGLVIAHEHVESSALTPSENARLSVVDGTIGKIVDPHEAANVDGLRAVRWMIENGAQTPFYFGWGAPSCVPATSMALETSGAELGVRDVAELLELASVTHLAEVMNFPGVLNGCPNVHGKIRAAQRLGKPIDGHAPGVIGDEIRRYIAAGPNTDHECWDIEHALERVQHGMSILIREGSAATNFDALHPLITSHVGQVQFCTDDAHPNLLAAGSCGTLVRRALANGHNLFDVLQCASLNPVRHYKLPMGLLQVGDSADFIVIDDPDRFNVLETYIGGQLVAKDGKSLLPRIEVVPQNNFVPNFVRSADLHVPHRPGLLRTMKVYDGRLITTEKLKAPNVRRGAVHASTRDDVLKIIVVNRYQPAKPSVAFIHGFGLKSGAIASSVAHDCHNVVAVGVNDEEKAQAINMVMESRGGLALVDGSRRELLPLPIYGLMSGDDGYVVARQYEAMEGMARSLGSPLSAPFMTLSFCCLLVIPALKLSDKGLFDGNRFEFTSLFAEEAEARSDVLVTSENEG